MLISIIRTFKLLRNNHNDFLQIVTWVSDFITSVVLVIDNL